MTYLTIIPFNTKAQLDELFANSSRVLEYFTVGDAQPLFIALLNDEQKNYLTSKNYEIRVVEADPQLDRYVLLRHPVPNQSSKLKPYGDITVLTSHYTLLKMPQGQEFTHDGVRGEFFDIRLDDDIVTPPYQTKTITAVPSQSPTIVKKSDSQSILVFYFIGVVVLVVCLTFIVRYIRRVRSSNL